MAPAREREREGKQLALVAGLSTYTDPNDRKREQAGEGAGFVGPKSISVQLSGLVIVLKQQLVEHLLPALLSLILVLLPLLPLSSASSSGSYKPLVRLPCLPTLRILI